MAWNARKTDLIKQLLVERIRIENNPDVFIRYGLTKTALQVISSHCNDATRQAILNELIDDKVAMLAIDRADTQAKDAALGDITTDLNTNKE